MLTSIEDGKKYLNRLGEIKTINKNPPRWEGDDLYRYISVPVRVDPEEIFDYYEDGKFSIVNEHEQDLIAEYIETEKDENMDTLKYKKVIEEGNYNGVEVTIDSYGDVMIEVNNHEYSSSELRNIAATLIEIADFLDSQEC